MNLYFSTCSLNQPQRLQSPYDVLGGWEVTAKSFLPDPAWKLIKKLLKRPESDPLRRIPIESHKKAWRWNVAAVRQLPDHNVFLDGLRSDGSPDFLSKVLRKKHPSYYSHCQKALRTAQAWERFTVLITTGDDVSHRDESCIPKRNGTVNAHERYPHIRGREDLPDEVRPPDTMHRLENHFGQTETHFYALSNIEFRYENFLDIISSVCPRTPEREKALAEYLRIKNEVLPPLDCQLL